MTEDSTRMPPSGDAQPRAGSYQWRAVRRGGAALRAIHDEQVLMWELFWQSSSYQEDGRATQGSLSRVVRPIHLNGPPGIGKIDDSERVR